MGLEMNKFEVTLKQLREHEACVSGYNKVVSALKGVEYDHKRETYIKFKHNEPISLLSILETNGLEDALWCLRCNDKEWARDSRLFAVWCARQVQHLMTDERSLKALDVAEKFANGEASNKDLIIARSAAGDAAALASSWAAASSAAGDAAWAARYARAAAGDAAWAARSAAGDDAWAAARAAAGDAQKAMFIKMCKGEADWQVTK